MRNVRELNMGIFNGKLKFSLLRSALRSHLYWYRQNAHQFEASKILNVLHILSRYSVINSRGTWGFEDCDFLSRHYRFMSSNLGASKVFTHDNVDSFFAFLFMFFSF